MRERGLYQTLQQAGSSAAPYERARLVSNVAAESQLVSAKGPVHPQAPTHGAQGSVHPLPLRTPKGRCTSTPTSTMTAQGLIHPLPLPLRLRLHQPSMICLAARRTDTHARKQVYTWFRWATTGGLKPLPSSYSSNAHARDLKSECAMMAGNCG